MKVNLMNRVFLVLFFLTFVSLSYAQKSPESLDDKLTRRQNLTVREYNTDANGKSRWLDHLTVYNVKGYKVEEIEYATYGMRERVLYEYNAANACVKEIVYDDRNKVSRIRKYEYNVDGTKKTQYNYLPNGRLYSTKHYDYANK